MTNVNRRQFIASVGATATAGAAIASAEAQWKGGSVTSEDFEPLIGDSFAVIDQETGERARLELVEIESKDVWKQTNDNNPRPAHLREPFTLVFKLKSSHTVSHGTHIVNHPALGNAMLYMAPESPDTYSICFT